jgi:hypothetical protein
MGTMRFPMRARAAWARGSSGVGQPSMKVRVPAAAPTTPPDMGASMKDEAVEWAETVLAMAMLVAGSIVDVSMKRRCVGRSGRGLGERMDS